MEGCQVGQERIYLNVTRVSLAQIPGGGYGEGLSLVILSPDVCATCAPNNRRFIHLSVCRSSQSGLQRVETYSTFLYIAAVGTYRTVHTHHQHFNISCHLILFLL